MRNDAKIGQMVREWLYQKKITQVEAAKFLGIKQPSLSQMLCARIPFPIDKLKALIKWLEPPQEEITEAIRLHLSQKGGSEISPILRLGLKVEAERQAMLHKSSDGLFIEFSKLWKNFDMTEKLQILSFANEINSKKNNSVTNHSVTEQNKD